MVSLDDGPGGEAFKRRSVYGFLVMIIAISALVNFKTGGKQAVRIIAVADLIAFDMPVTRINAPALYMSDITVYFRRFLKGKRINIFALKIIRPAMGLAFKDGGEFGFR